jgi:thiosulfate/3-mercaptopyruvate sulfurtransferase
VTADDPKIVPRKFPVLFSSDRLATRGDVLDEPALRTKLAKAGVKPGEPVIIHCQGGGRASVDAFVFERLGFPTRNYYLGWSDWGNAEDTPVETGSPASIGPR